MVFYMTTMTALPTTATHTTNSATTSRPATRPAKTTQTIYVESITAMTLLFIVGVGVPTWIGYGSLDAALALGLFSAFWGGPGFGAMAAGARISMRDNAEAEQAH